MDTTTEASSRPRRGQRWIVALAAVAGFLALGRPAAAWFTVADNEKGKLEVEARIQFLYTSAEKQALADQTGRIDDFAMRRVRLLARGRVSKAFTYQIQIGQDNVNSKLATEDAGFRIKDAYLNYRAVDGFQIGVGQLKVPFLRQNLESAFNQLLIDRAALTGFRPAREGSRDVGVLLWGNHGGLQYRAGLFDGSDQEAKNPGSNPRGTIRLAYNLFTPETDLGYTGSHLGAKRVLHFAFQADTQSSRLEPKDERDFVAEPRDYRALAAEVYYDQPIGKSSALTIEAAYLDRRDDYENADLATRDQDGYYIQGGFLIPGKIGPGRLQVVSRFEDSDIERGETEIGSRRSTIGLNWLAKGHDRKIQIDYTWKREEPTEIRNDELRIAVVGVF